MAEVLLRRHLEDRGVAAEVSSAGLMFGGSPATPAAIEALAADGLDLSGHVSRQATRDLLDQSDLVITMERQHMIELTLMAPDSWPRIFQLVDLVRRAEQVGPRPPGQPFPDWVALLGEGRTRSDILAARLSDDVADPIGQPRSAYDRTKKQLDDLLSRLSALV